MLVGGGAFAARRFAGVAFANDWTLDAVAMVALGLGFYMLHNSFQTQVTEVAPKARASAVALHAFSFFCGQALGPLSLGFGFAAIGEAPTLLLGGAGRSWCLGS